MENLKLVIPWKEYRFRSRVLRAAWKCCNFSYGCRHFKNITFIMMFFPGFGLLLNHFQPSRMQFPPPQCLRYIYSAIYLGLDFLAIVSVSLTLYLDCKYSFSYFFCPKFMYLKFFWTRYYFVQFLWLPISAFS